LAGTEGTVSRGQQPLVPIRTQSPDATAGRSLADVAAAVGETLVGPDGQPIRATRPLQTPPQAKQQAAQQQNATAAKPRPAGATVGVKLYTAEPGDSLSRIAARQMVANTKAHRDAIVRANPGLAADPNKIIVGQTYNIPLAAGQGAQAPSAASTDRANRTERAAAPIRASGGEFWYEVKPGDNLWKIAKTQLGDSGTVHAIKELNKESVKNWDVLLAGTRIKLPARPLASVQ
jgi:nucleoid-associated protein YgaU